jgi:hypothetical protein
VRSALVKTVVPFEARARLGCHVGDRAFGRTAMDRHHDAAGEPYAEVSDEIERLVGDSNVDRLVRGQARIGEGPADTLCGVDELRVRHSGHRGPGGVLRRRLEEQLA